MSENKECLVFLNGEWIEAELIGVFQFSNIFDPSPMVGGHKGGVVAYPVAVVKVNGKLLEVKLSNVKQMTANDKVKTKNVETLKKLIHDVEHGNKDITLRELKAIKWCINELEQGGKHG